MRVVVVVVVLVMVVVDGRPALPPMDGRKGGGTVLAVIHGRVICV